MTVRAALAVMVAIGSIGVIDAGTVPAVEALVPTENFRFVEPMTLLNLGTGAARGAEVVLPPSPHRRIVNLDLSEASEPSWVYFHPCGTPVDRTRPAAAFVDPLEREINLAPINPSETCLTRFGDADVRLYAIGEQGDVPGLGYVAHPEPTAVPVQLVPDLGNIVRVNVRDGSVPADAEAVALWVGVRFNPGDNDSFSGVVLLPCDGSNRSAAQQIRPSRAGRFGDNLLVARIDATGVICLLVPTVVPEQISIRRYGYLQPGVTPTPEGLPFSGWVEQEAPGFVPQPPARLFDTRDNGGAPLGDGQTYRHRFTGLPSGATAVALNITVTGTSGPGFVSAYPCDAGGLPEVSNVNYGGAGLTVPNFAIVSLGATNEVCFYTLRSTHLLVDVAGYFEWEGGDGFISALPTRLFDTRQGARVAADSTYVLDLTGRVSPDATAVAMNLTATQTAGPGFLTVYPCGQPLPTVSSVNYGANETRPNLVTVQIPADKKVCIYSPTATHAFADLAGWFTPSSNIGMFDGDPFRVFDSREPAGEPPYAAGDEVFLTFDPRYLRALAWNLTATQTGGPGFISSYPCGEGGPTVSNVNYSARGETVANFAFLRPATTNGRLCFFTLNSAHLIADEFGYFVVPVPFEIFYDGTPPRLVGAASFSEL